MLASSRRDMILSAAAAAVAPSLGKGLGIAVAHKKKAQTPDPGFRMSKVGAAEIVAPYRGIREPRRDGIYFATATSAEVKRARMAFVPIPVTVFAIRPSGQLTVCDVGGGDQVQEFNPETVFESEAPAFPQGTRCPPVRPVTAPMQWITRWWASRCVRADLSRSNRRVSSLEKWSNMIGNSSKSTAPSANSGAFSRWSRVHR
jgi:hypothetical protein